MKVGINISIDVTKIDKTKLYNGKNGTYLNLTTFVDTDKKDQYENNGFISHSVSKEEREAGQKGRIVGNCKVFYSTGRSEAPTPLADGGQRTSQAAEVEESDDIPF
jgi:hypothetical protein